LEALDEFVVWLTDDPTVNVLEQEALKFAAKPGIQMVTGQGESGQIATYTLGEGTGYGLVCYLQDPEQLDGFRKTYNKMVRSFTLTVADEEVTTGTDSCSNLLSGVTTPIKDQQMFTDDTYTEATKTARDAWNKQKLPAKVTQLEGEGYTCLPMPAEFDSALPRHPDRRGRGRVSAPPAPARLGQGSPGYRTGTGARSQPEQRSPRRGSNRVP